MSQEKIKETIAQVKVIAWVKYISDKFQILYYVYIYKKKWGSWVAQSVKWPTSAQVMIS